MVGDVGLLNSRQIEPLLKEANELVAILVASRKTAITFRSS
jgi:hypothetical protein